MDQYSGVLESARQRRIWARVLAGAESSASAGVLAGADHGDCIHGSMESGETAGANTDAGPWPEISGSEQDAAPGGTAQLLSEFLHAEYRDRRYYKKLACLAPNRAAARVLRELADNECRNFKRLSAQYFVLTGEKHHCETGSEIQTIDYCEGLRSRYISETNDAEAYFKAANTDGISAPLKKLFLELAEGGKCNAEKLMKLMSA